MTCTHTEYPSIDAFIPDPQFLTSSDELSILVQALRYVEADEPSIGRVILVHCYTAVEDIPTELESNHQLVDEAFPHITVDLVFVEAPFETGTLHLLSRKLGVATSRFFVSRVCAMSSDHIADGCPLPTAHCSRRIHLIQVGCPGTVERQDVLDLSGARIIM